MDEGLAYWFAREILSHEAALTRYINRSRLVGFDSQDIRQEIYIKVLQAAMKSRPVEPRFFLFAVARNLMADLARQRRVVPIDLLQDYGDSPVLTDEVSPERQAGSFQELERLIDAFELLPDRCRDVLWMKKIDGESQRDIAQQLKITEATVEAHLVRGMRLLTQFFYADPTDSEPQSSRWKITRKWNKLKKPPPRGS